MENETEVLNEEIQEEEVTPIEEVEEEEKPLKPQETPEAKLVRLKRMVVQEEKRQGIQKAEPKSEAKPEPKANLEVTLTDGYALAKANIHPDDISEVKDYAEFKGISIAEALKNSVVKNTLAEKEEFRKSAETANTKNTRKSSVNLSGDDLLENARKGKFPESDEGIENLAKAHIENLKKQRGIR